MAHSIHNLYIMSTGFCPDFDKRKGTGSPGAPDTEADQYPA
jgi:hypothetical protein